MHVKHYAITIIGHILQVESGAETTRQVIVNGQQTIVKQEPSESGTPSITAGVPDPKQGNKFVITPDYIQQS